MAVGSCSCSHERYWTQAYGGTDSFSTGNCRRGPSSATSRSSHSRRLCSVSVVTMPNWRRSRSKAAVSAELLRLDRSVACLKSGAEAGLLPRSPTIMAKSGGRGTVLADERLLDRLVYARQWLSADGHVALWARRCARCTRRWRPRRKGYQHHHQQQQLPPRTPRQRRSSGARWRRCAIGTSWDRCGRTWWHRRPQEGRIRRRNVRNSRGRPAPFSRRMLYRRGSTSEVQATRRTGCRR